METYWNELKGKKLTAAMLAELPDRCVSRSLLEDAVIAPVLAEPYPPSTWLQHRGFPEYIYNDPLHDKPFATLNDIHWKWFMLIAGEYRTGKTSLAANCLYWRGYQLLSRKHEVNVDRFDTAELTEILVMADKDFDGLPSACDRHVGGEQSGEHLYDRIEHALKNREQLLILDDFNIDALSNEAQVKKVNQLVMGRYMNKQPTWLITNESVPVMEAKFPRLMSRVTNEDDWGLLEKSPFEAALE